MRVGDEMKLDLDILDEKRRQVYLLRKEGNSFRTIAKEVGVSAATACRYHRQALRTLELSLWYQKKIEEFSEKVDFSLTKGELGVILDSLWLMERALLRRKEHIPENKYQEEYLWLKKYSFLDIKERMEISVMGEEKYRMMHGFK